MRKKLKVAGITLGVIVLVILIAVSFVAFRGIPSYESGNIAYSLVSTPESIARGKKLALMLCANCHRNPETGNFTGTQMLDAPKEFGLLFSTNITQDKVYGIGDWTDGELVYLLRTGIKRDGQYAPPYMAKLPKMADSDINAIISYLRSDDELVAPKPVPDKPIKPTFLTKLLSNIAWKPLPMPKQSIQLPDSAHRIELGKYLAQNLDCFACHSADFKSVDPLNPEKSKGYFAGGNKTLNKNGQVIPTANLTPDNKTGIGSWTEEKFVRALKYGIKPGEKALQYPMMPYAQLTDTEAKAIFAYLQTIPAIENDVKRVGY